MGNGGTVTHNHHGHGMFVDNGATVTATQCEFMGNCGQGVYCSANTKARLNDCKMHHNGTHGLSVTRNALVDLHGTKTDCDSVGADLYGAIGHDTGPGFWSKHRC